MDLLEAYTYTVQNPPEFRLPGDQRRGTGAVRSSRLGKCLRRLYKTAPLARVQWEGLRSAHQACRHIPWHAPLKFESLSLL